MTKAYCLTCRKSVEVCNAKNKTTSNGRKMLTGTCKKCDRKVFAFIKG